MYIPVAVCLAWIFLHQHLSRRQVLGLIGAVLGVVLIAVD
jgi:drug/metabolite transporter (DMT)-like permease